MPLDRYAEGGDFLVVFAPVDLAGVHVHPGIAGIGAGIGQAERFQCIDGRCLQESQKIAHLTAHRKDRVGHQLTRSVVGHVSATLNFQHLDALAREVLARHEDVVALARAPAQRQHRQVFHKQQRGLSARHHPRVVLALKLPRLAVGHHPEVEYVESQVLHVPNHTLHSGRKTVPEAEIQAELTSVRGEFPCLRWSVPSVFQGRPVPCGRGCPRLPPSTLIRAAPHLAVLQGRVHAEERWRVEGETYLGARPRSGAASMTACASLAATSAARSGARGPLRRDGGIYSCWPLLALWLERLRGLASRASS